MAKFGVIKNIEFQKRAKGLLFAETKKQILIIKRVTIVFLIFYVSIYLYQIGNKNNANNELIKEKLELAAMYNLQLEKEKSRFVELSTAHADKLAKTVNIEPVKNELSTLYSALTVSGILNMEEVRAYLQKSDAQKECYNKAVVVIQFNSSKRNIQSFDGIIDYFTEIFVDERMFKKINISNGRAVMEYKKSVM